MDKEELYKSMIFNYETVNRTDYQPYKLTAPIKTIYEEKTKNIRTKISPLKDVHTMSEWDRTMVPFDLLHQPKDIIRQDPRKIQGIYEKPIDKDRLQVQKSRPRLVMTPAVSMDDIEDQKAREMLCNDMYTTSIMRANAEIPAFSKKPLNLTLPAAAQPITLPPLRPSYVPPEWRFESVGWDRKQLRTYVDPTKEFWLSRAQK